MKNTALKLCLLTALFCLFQLKSNATHLMGGEITWKCLTNGSYQFQLVLYGDCNGNLNLFGATETINSNSPAGNFTVFKQSEEDVSPTCTNATPNLQISCNKAINSTNPVPGAVRKITYTGIVASLNGVPPVNGWEFSWEDCCRPNGDLNHTSNSYYLRSKMYPYSPTPGGPALNASTCYDNSPEFGEIGAPVICTGYKFTYNHLAVDVDLDSTAFATAEPFQSANTPITWINGYSASAAFPDNSEDILNGPVTLDPVSGEMTMEVYGFGTSATDGSFASCVKIEAWKDCQLVAEVYRDVSITLLTTGCTPNIIPTLAIDTSVYTNINQNGSIYRTSIYPGNKLEFEISSIDPNFSDLGVPEEITFKASGLQVDNSMSSTTGCSGNGPCATFTPIAPQVGYTQGLQNNIKFEWTPSCANLNAAGNCGGVNSTYYFTMKMSDDRCPAPGVAISTLIVDVIAGDPTPPPLTSVFIEDNGDMTVSWNEAEQDILLEFKDYILYASAGSGGTFVPIDTIAKIDSLQTLVPNGSGYSCFYLTKRTGECFFESEPSDIFCTMVLNMNATPAFPNSEFAHLEWTPLTDELPTSSKKFYEIWSKPTNGTWEIVDSVAESTNPVPGFTYKYDDTVNVCVDSVTYRILVFDLKNNFISGSNLRGATFSDVSNNDIMELVTASVDIDGKAVLDWTQSTSEDVVAYYIMFNDPLDGWTIIDTVNQDGLTLPYTWDGSMADSRSEQFKVVSVDACQNMSDERVVVSHNTIFLESDLNKCEGTASISWNKYDGFTDDPVSYELYVSVDAGSGFAAPVLLHSANDAEYDFEHLNLTKDYQYCYSVLVTDATGLKTSTSNVVCITADVPQKSRILYLSQVTNNPAKNSIDIKAFIDGGADIANYVVERASEKNGIYSPIGSVAHPTTAPFVINFSDFSADDRSTYYYRLRSNNICGGIDGMSNTSNNLVLNIAANSNLTNSLNWNSYEEWGGTVGRYDIYRSVNNDLNFSLIGSNSGLDLTFTDNISEFRNESGKFSYYVIAVEDDNPLGFVDNNGEPFKSLSNQVRVNQEAKIYVPTAFRPESDVEENKTFGPSIRFDEVSEYDFYVLNRWGSIMFRTNDPEEFWDGKVDGELAPTGVYVYYLKYSTIDDTPKEEKGVFSLIN